MKIKTFAPKRAIHLSIVIVLVSSLLSFMATPAHALPNLPAIVTCGSGQYTIAVDPGDEETVAYGGGNCTGTVEIPEGVTVIGNSAFWNAQITGITLPNSLKRIDASAIRSTQITSLVIPANVRSIGELGVASYGITSLTFASDSQLTTIGPSAFQGLSITSISIPSSVTSMNASALETFGTLSSIRFEGNAPNIVGGNSLTGLNQNTTFLTSPGAQGFEGSGWSGLTVVSPPAAPTNLIATVGAGQVSIAFTPGSNNGADITNYKYSIDNGTTYSALSPADSTSPIVISGLTQSQYVIRIKAINASGDGTASNSLTVTPDPPVVISVRAIGGVTPPFKGSTPVTTVTEANGYTGTISWSGSPSRFTAATSYTATISLAASPGYTFSGVVANFFTVVGATSVSNPANSGTITAVFPSTSAARCYLVIDRELTNGYGCSGEVIIEDGVTIIGRNDGGGAFQSNSSITSVVIPASVTEIKDEAFLSATNLTSVVFSNGSNLTRIGGVAFKQTTRLNSITLPSNINEISYNAFDRSGIQEFTFEGAAPRIIKDGGDFAPGLVSRVFSNGWTNQSTAIGWVTSTNLNSFNSRFVLTTIAVRGVTPPFILSPSNGAYFYGQVGTPFPNSYNMSFTEAGTATASYSGTLPPGISMNSAGQFSGTPTTANSYIVSLTVTAGLTRSRTVTDITFVISPPSQPSIDYPSANSTITRRAGAPINITMDSFAAGQKVITTSAGALPTGVTLNSSGEFSGTPSVPGTYTFALTIADSYDQSSTNENITIVVLPEFTGIASLTATRSVIAAPNGGSEIVYSVIQTNVPSDFYVGAFFRDDQCTDGDFSLDSFTTVMNSEYTNTGLPSEYTCSGTSTWVFRIYDSDEITPNIDSPYLASVTVEIVTGSTEIPIISYPTSNSTFNGQVGTTFNLNVTYNSGVAPEVFAVTSGALPPGLSLNNSGRITGTPTTAGTYTASITLTDSTTASSTASSIRFVIAAGISYRPTITAPARVTGTVGSAIEPINMTLGSGTGSKTVTVAANYSLPAGLTVSAAGRISGTPTVAGTTSTRFTVTDSASETAMATVQFVIEYAPVPFLNTVTPPQLRLQDGKLICTAGTYQSGYTVNGVIQSSSTSIYSPTSYVYNIFANGVSQTSLTVTSSLATMSWNLPAVSGGSLITCSVSVSGNTVTNTSTSAENTSGVGTAQSVQTKAIAEANSMYSDAISANAKAYQKALVENRDTWRKQIETIRTDYYTELDRIKSLGTSRSTQSLLSAALKVRLTMQKKSAADYAASKPAALSAKDSANNMALSVKNAAISKANDTYRKYIELIGYGVFIP